MAVEADVSDRRSVGAMVDEVVSGLEVDILINNAAVYPRRAWTEIEEEEWDRVMAVNLKGYFLCAASSSSHEGAGTGKTKRGLDHLFHRVDAPARLRGLEGWHRRLYAHASPARSARTTST